MLLRTGCSGFPVDRETYFTKFDVVEMDRTFYRLPSEQVLRQLGESAPEGFEFTMKAFRLITHRPVRPSHLKGAWSGEKAKYENYGHFRPTDEVLKEWERTARAAEALGARVVVFQSPASFLPERENVDNMKAFFRTIDRKGLTLVWEPAGEWDEKTMSRMCGELDIVCCVDPFIASVEQDGMRYLRLRGIEGQSARYRGWDLKKLRDYAESEARRLRGAPLYVIFDNRYRYMDAQRFDWIMRNTGRIREMDLSMLEGLCTEIESAEEEENVRALSREAERIVSLILYTDYKKVDVEIEAGKLRDMCREMFPDKEDLYDMVYGGRFQRLWEQFREPEE
jgi:uncharacterized protein YecE (DUF72 family)